MEPIRLWQSFITEADVEEEIESNDEYDDDDYIEEDNEYYED